MRAAATIALVSSRVRHAVSRMSSVARHSLTAPERRASRVCGISCTSALPSPRSLLPAWGDSRRARATSAATPRPRLAADTPAASSCTRREVSKSAASTAWAADAAALRSSSARSRSMRSASARGTPTARPLSGADTTSVINLIDNASGSSEGPVNPGASGLISCVVMAPIAAGTTDTDPHGSSALPPSGQLFSNWLSMSCTEHVVAVAPSTRGVRAGHTFRPCGSRIVRR